MKNNHIVVCGGGFAGKLAAIMASRASRRVTLVERYPDGEASRYAGTPQAQHVHIMSKKGQNIFEQLLPGVLEELQLKGAKEVDWALNTVWQGTSGRCPNYKSGVRSLLFSRKLIEKVLYARVRAIPNIEYKVGGVKDFRFDKLALKTIVLNQGDVIEGFDLCIDARGRTSHLKQDLEEILGPIPESIIRNTLRYATTVVDHKTSTDENAIVQYYSQANAQDTPLGYFASPIEGDRMIVTTVDYHGNIPKPFEVLKNHPALRGKTIGETHVFTKLHNHHIRYGDAKKWISNFVVLGDAVCRLNPVYGHGLTLTLEQVALWNDHLQSSDSTTRKLQKAIDTTIREPWNFVKVDELRSPQASPNLYYRTVHKFVDFMGTATLRDEALHKTSLEVLHRLKNPLALVTPRNLLRALRVHVGLNKRWFGRALGLVAALLCLLLSNRAKAEIHERTLRAGSINLHILESGSPDKDLIVFLHGFPEYSGIWREYLERLGRDYHAVALDQRGYNLSDKPSSVESYRIDRLVLDVRNSVAALGHRKAMLVSHDWGGLIAWHAIDKYPEVFSKAVIINAPHPKIYSELLKNDEEQKNKSRYLDFLTFPGTAFLLSWNDFYLLRRKVFSKDLSSAEQEGYRKAWRQGLSSPIAYYKANSLKDQGELFQIKPTKIPVLVVWGERDDWLSKRNLEGLDLWAEKLTIKRYPDASHWLPRERFTEVLKDIQTFVGGS